MTGSHISLFSGVGMTDIATEAAGFKTIATAEIDPWNRSVLAARLPDARHYPDVRKITSEQLVFDGLRPIKRPLLISGGFPCQDVSVVGRGVGIDGARSGLWGEFARVIREFLPEYVLIENSPALKHRGLDRVLNDLHHAGYDAQWDCLPAASVGAPHLRDRIYIGAVRRSGVNGRVTGTKIIGHAGVPGNGCVKAGEAVTRLPRAGAMVGGLLFERKPKAPIREAKKACLLGELLPTPVASDDGKSPEAHLAMKARLPGGARRQITSLAVLARAGFPEDRGRSMSERLFPTPTRADGTGGPGTTPKREGGKNLRTVIAETEGNGRLNPSWLEWMMGLPGGWTNPAVPTYSLQEHGGWHSEHGIPRTTDKNVAHRGKRVTALGNGLVPQVAAIALNDLLNW